MMKKWNRLTAGLLCAILAAALIVPVSAHGCHGRRGGGCHGRYVQNVQTEITVCPYDGCAETGRHYHDSVAYCGYNHAGAYCDGTCAGYCVGTDPAAGNAGSYAYYGCGFGYANGHGHHGGC